MQQGRMIALAGAGQLCLGAAAGIAGFPAGAAALSERDGASLIDETLRLADEAKRAGSADACAGGSTEGVRLQCVAIYAEHSADPALCRGIPATTSEHVDLRDLCISEVAKVRGEPGMCEEVVAPGLRDSCYLKLKREIGDAALCSRIADAGLKSACTGEPVIIR